MQLHRWQTGVTILTRRIGATMVTNHSHQIEYNCQICEIVSARDASASEKYKILRQADIVRFSLNFV